jgi:hypothetical protein
MNTDKSKIIRIRQCRLSQYPFHRWENEKLVEQCFIDNMMCEFKRTIAQLKPEDIINIREEDGCVYYDIDVVIKKY